jgi:hypothetical protein
MPTFLYQEGRELGGKARNWTPEIGGFVAHIHNRYAMYRTPKR